MAHGVYIHQSLLQIISSCNSEKYLKLNSKYNYDSEVAFSERYARY